MTTNAIAISRGLEAAGIEKKHADAIAEAVATHSDEHLATKSDVAELRAELKVNDERAATKSDVARIEAKLARIEAKSDTQFRISVALFLAIFITLLVGNLNN